MFLPISSLELQALVFQPFHFFSVNQMSTDSKLLPLLNNSLDEIETIHDILFSAKASFSNAIAQRPSCTNKVVPRLYDGEKILLAAIDKVLLHAKKAAGKISKERNDLLATVQSTERSRANYVSALKKLANARNIHRVSSRQHNLRMPTKSMQKLRNNGASSNELPAKKLSNTTHTVSPRVLYPPAKKSFSASPRLSTSAFHASNAQFLSAQSSEGNCKDINHMQRVFTNPPTSKISAGKKVKRMKQLQVMKRTEISDTKSMLSLGGSSLDDVIANLPIDEPTQSLDRKSEETSTSCSFAESRKATFSLREDSIDDIFKASPTNGNVESIAPADRQSLTANNVGPIALGQKIPNSGSGANISKKNKQQIHAAEKTSTRKSKRPAALAGAVYKEEFASDDDL